ncbi:MAG: response regulator [Roseburia sp.]|nr:response regulator [Ruminococcus sp.]MCM1156459.1 response regulator [Roseburia sp.]MCM1243304.1 response regulator [Roseburia sp.]
MKTQLVWQERFNIGVNFIDREHRKLFSILNRLFANSKEGKKSQWVCQEGIKYFKDHAMKHFTEEEVYMASIQYPGFETHRRLHNDFRLKTLPGLEKELRETNYSPEAINHFLGVCAGWLVGHTLTEDRAITGNGTSKWDGLLPEEEQAAMKQIIIQLLRDLFQVETKVLSECYGGEKFGQGIYYRLVYGNEKEDKWEFILILEEKLILNTMKSVMELESEAVSVLLVNAVRYTAQQIVNRIKEHFPDEELYEIKEENLLTYDQFHMLYERQSPQYSMLFDTGEGYFAYCVMAPHIVSKIKGETPIKAENAVSEITKYLENEANQQKKKKILVVDDSMVMCQAMVELFGKEYDVSTAQSGLAAIRCITLDRPHLVLLDYEMPVCDGSQVLEMIRAESDFADIPVMFLTGRVDAESVKKVIALKPAGYFAKSMPLPEVKKNIDEYLSKL